MILRRVATLTAITLSLASCAFAGQEAQQSSSDTDESDSAPVLPAVSAFEVSEDEPAPEAKRTAVRFLEAAFNYEAEGGTPEAARERLEAAGVLHSTDRLDTPLLSPGTAAATQVVYPQLGGLTEDAASVMTVIEFTTLREQELSTRIRTVDVRLEQKEQGWTVTGIASDGGAPPETETTPSDPAERVLASDRIQLPDSSRWDILAGDIDDRTLEMMLSLSAERTISVAVLSTGHPINVFDSDSVSNHIHGRAVDIWAIDGVPVSDLRSREETNPARALMELALAEGATEVGGPWAFSTSAGASFTDTVHQDHLHIGFKQ
ncbi:hypothetical protein [Nocardiopsis tropica]|uniref:Uncharacterized protein n=1 Tax=Nocardiopsis tropica TaxID=109330 RepID=A0ABU7KJZ5_9ACTN|nr:hypothetical protein [Nocardiopsis umidischolae]MEE2049609.1 hypothetical protein [Nocardiopsis umidischolae]